MYTYAARSYYDYLYYVMYMPTVYNSYETTFVPSIQFFLKKLLLSKKQYQYAFWFAVICWC